MNQFLNNEKQVIILFGQPGAGKGTQGILLADRLSLYYFETSKILEDAFKKSENKSINIDGKEYSAEEEKKLWENGMLCDPPFVVYFVQEKIKELAKKGENLLLAGSPRTLYEAEKIMPLVEKLYGKENIKSILIEITAEQTIWRNSHRRICELMRHPILYTKETAKLEKCPLDGSVLIRREGLDNPETIKTRLKEYQERTFPIFEYFEKQGFSIKKINGEQSVAEVFNDILKALK